MRARFLLPAVMPMPALIPSSLPALALKDPDWVVLQADMLHERHGVALVPGEH